MHSEVVCSSLTVLWPSTISVFTCALIVLCPFSILVLHVVDLCMSGAMYLDVFCMNDTISFVFGLLGTFYRSPTKR